MTFFVGSLLFTSAAALQWLETINADPGPANRAGRLKIVTLEPRRIDWWSSGVQLVGTVFFNVTTFRGIQTSLESTSYDQLVWRPDALGSISISACLRIPRLRRGLRAVVGLDRSGRSNPGSSR